MDWHTRRRVTPTNALVVDSEAHDIRNYLSKAEIDLKLLNERITATRALLDELLAQHSEVTAGIKEYRIALAPHKKLPRELLIKIFQYCVPDQISIPPKLYDAPLLLCQIFSYWRRVALGTPTLWNRIAVQFQVNSLIDPVDLSVITKTWLDRSGVSTPLSITLSVDRHCRWNPFQALVPHIPRCREIVLCVTASSLRHFLQSPGGCAGILEVLKIKVDDNDDDEIDLGESWPDIATVFHSAHRLCRFTFTSNDGMFNGPQLLQLPCSQLTDLHLVGTWVNPDTCHAILRRCTNLVSCTMFVEACGAFTQILAYLSPTVVPNLRRLQLHPRPFESYASFLRPLVLPALKDFELASPSNWSSAAVKSLCSRSSFDLERFAIVGVHVDGPRLESLLENMPSLIELDIRSQRWLNESTLDLISKGDLIPKLEVIKFTSFPFIEAVDVIESRWRLDINIMTKGNSWGSPVSRLREVVLSRGDIRPVSKSALVRLRAFRREGLLVSYN